MKINHYSEVQPISGQYEFIDCQGREFVYNVHKTIWGRVTVKSYHAIYWYSDPPSIRYSDFIKPIQPTYYFAPHYPYITALNRKTEDKVTWQFEKLVNGSKCRRLDYDSSGRFEGAAML